MATGQTGISDDKGDLSDIKRKLAWRMAFAGLMIVALLGGLALFDYLSTRPREQESISPQFTQPVPVAKKALTQPVTPAEPVAEVKEEKIAVPESTSAPVDKSAPKAELPPRPEVAAQPALPRASQPAARAAVTPGPAAVSKPSEPRAAVVSIPPSRAEPAMPAPAAPIRLYSGFALQAGVFADPRRAEELHAKLTLEGIPSTIEARVQAGPFKSREEAEAARVKMKALGIDAVMLMPKGVRR
jgi:cell division septation protein DedD